MMKFFTSVKKSVEKLGTSVSRLLRLSLKNHETREISTPEIRDMAATVNENAALADGIFAYEDSTSNGNGIVNPNSSIAKPVYASSILGTVVDKPKTV